MNPRKMSLVLAIWAATAMSSGAVEIWIAPDGDDQNPGTKERPLVSVALAQRKARELRRLNDPSVAGGIHLVLRGGTHVLTTPLLFRWEDSGTAASPTVVEAAPGERPVLSGGMAIAGWQPVGDVTGLPAGARGFVRVAEAPRVGGRPLGFRQLWVDGRKAVRARHPNGAAMSRLAAWDRRREVATIPAASLGGVVSPRGLELFVLQQWEIAILRVKGIEHADGAARVTFEQPESRVEFEHPWPQPILPPEGAGAFFAVNAIELLDAPGEWFQDAGGRVYCWPGEGIALGRAAAVAPALETILEVQGTLDRPVTHVQFKGIGFAHSAWKRPGAAGHVPLQAGMHLLEAYKIAPPGTPDKRGLENQAWIGRMPAAVVVTAARNIAFERCRFEQIAASALDLGRGVQDSAVVGCVFRDIGGNGVQLGFFQEGGVETHVPYLPEDERELCARVRIANNFLTDTANEDWGCVAVIAGYARELTIEHNEISQTSYSGISVGWGWTRTANASRDHRITANLIHHFATRMCDTAAIYTLSAQPGTVVSGNVAHSVTISPYVDRPEHWFYYYTDEGSSFTTWRDNWSPEERILKNANGPGNVWENNGPGVAERIRQAAGIEPAWRDAGNR